MAGAVRVVIIVDVFVPGAAKTKGSMEVRNRATGAMRESVVGSSRWRALMADAVRTELTRRQRTGPWAGPVAVHVLAHLSPPDASWAARLWAYWYQAGDLDKLVRNVLDALGSTSKNPKMNGGAIIDDNLVCRLVAEKVVAGSLHTTVSQAGVRIIVETL